MLSNFLIDWLIKWGEDPEDSKMSEHLRKTDVYSYSYLGVALSCFYVDNAEYVVPK